MGVRMKDEDAKPLVHGLLDDWHHCQATPGGTMAWRAEVCFLGQGQDSSEQEGISPAEISMTDQSEGHVFVCALAVYNLLEDFAKPEWDSKLHFTHLG